MLAHIQNDSNIHLNIRHWVHNGSDCDVVWAAPTAGDPNRLTSVGRITTNRSCCQQLRPSSTSFLRKIGLLGSDALAMSNQVSCRQLAIRLEVQMKMKLICCR